MPDHYPAILPFPDHILYNPLELEDEEKENEEDDDTPAQT